MSGMKLVEWFQFLKSRTMLHLPSSEKILLLENVCWNGEVIFKVNKIGGVLTHAISESMNKREKKLLENNFFLAAVWVDARSRVLLNHEQKEDANKTFQDVNARHHRLQQSSDSSPCSTHAPFSCSWGVYRNKKKLLTYVLLKTYLRRVLLKTLLASLCCCWYRKKQPNSKSLWSFHRCGEARSFWRSQRMGNNKEVPWYDTTCGTCRQFLAHNTGISREDVFSSEVGPPWKQSQHGGRLGWCHYFSPYK